MIENGITCIHFKRINGNSHLYLENLIPACKLVISGPVFIE